MDSPSSETESIPAGAQLPASTWGEYNNIMFAVQQALGKMQTATLVRVEACTNTGALAAVGFVDVTPLVNQIDAAGVPTPHITIFNIPYLRVQGGTNAIIMDPVVGDIGMCVFASRDISKIKSTKAQGNPGSFRQFSFSDGMYIGGMLNAVPDQYVMFSASGIKLHSPTGITLDANTTINGDLHVTGNLTVDGGATVTGAVSAGNGASGTFLSKESKTVVVSHGIVTSITP